jgi:hypothetical protein
LESKDKDNFTPLLLAACYGHAKSVELLINRGADMSVEDKNDRTAVYLAAEEDQLDVLEVISCFNSFVQQFNSDILLDYSKNRKSFCTHPGIGVDVTYRVLHASWYLQNYLSGLVETSHSLILQDNGRSLSKTHNTNMDFDIIMLLFCYEALRIVEHAVLLIALVCLSYYNWIILLFLIFTHIAAFAKVKYQLCKNKKCCYNMTMAFDIIFVEKHVSVV